MKYETPELVALTPAINAVQSSGPKSTSFSHTDSSPSNEATLAYEDWED